MICRIWGLGWLAVLLLLSAAGPGLAAEGQEHGAHGHAGHQHSMELAELMGGVYQEFAPLVEKALLAAAQRPLQDADYQALATRAQALVALAIRLQQLPDRDAGFHRHAQTLAAAAGEIAGAAASQQPAELSQQVGALAGACAACHHSYRW